MSRRRGQRPVHANPAEPSGATSRRAPSIRAAYVEHPSGAAGFYAEQGASYRNPHEAGVRAAIARLAPRLPEGRILDLACGSGEVSLALIEAGVDRGRIDAADPYTGAAYRERVGAEAADWSFEQAAERLHTRYGAVICSFALHLCPRSRLPVLALALAQRAEVLVVLTPHKRPAIDPRWGWTLEEERYDPTHRVRSRLYRSGAPR